MPPESVTEQLARRGRRRAAAIRAGADEWRLTRRVRLMQANRHVCAVTHSRASFRAIPIRSSRAIVVARRPACSLDAEDYRHAGSVAGATRPGCREGRVDEARVAGLRGRGGRARAQYL